MRSPRIVPSAVFLSLAVSLTLSHAALAQRSPGIGGMGRGMAGAFHQPFRSGFTAGGFIGGRFGRGFFIPGGFRNRLTDGFPAGPMLGPIGFGFEPGGGLLGVPSRFGFVFFHGFPFAAGFFFPGAPFFPRFPHRVFGFFPPAFPFGFGAVPFGFPFGLSVGSVGTDAPPAQRTEIATTRATPRAPDPPTLGRKVAAAGIAPDAGDSLLVERVSVMDVVPATVLRLTWRSAGLEAAQVALFLADSAQAVLASQTLHGQPFTALLDPPPGTAYAGLTVEWPDGTTTSRLLPYRVRPR
jgi:hypothetical protein